MEVSEFKLPEEPQFFAADDILKLMEYATSVGASDITIATGARAKIHVSGRMFNITSRALEPHEVESFVPRLYRGNGLAVINSGKPIDQSFSFRGKTYSAKKLIRFRINIAACRGGETDGIQITARTIVGKPPSLEAMRVEPAILEAAYPDRGLVLVCGETGAGKSSLLSSLLANLLVNQDGKGTKLVTAEAPIEYVYDEVNVGSNSVIQSEIPTHIESFAMATRNAMRQAPTHILVGETRDRETMAATLDAAVTGHTVYSTLHAGSTHEAIYRMLNLYPPEYQAAKVVEIIEALRLVVCQTLVRRRGGGRIAVREYLVFTEEIRDELRMAGSVVKIVDAIKKATETHGVTMKMAALNLAREALIDERDADILLKSHFTEDDDE